MTKIGSGIFSWCSSERRSRRYGTLWLTGSNYENSEHANVEWLKETAMAFVGKRVSIYAVVVKSRVSGHAGDHSIGMSPSRPKEGEKIDLGVGRFFISEEAFKTCGISPSDGRSEFWIDPTALYRLHDQTVEIFAEETEAQETPRPNIVAENGAFSNGDGTFQVSGAEFETGVFIPPVITDLGGGAFSVTTPIGSKGSRIRGTRPL